MKIILEYVEECLGLPFLIYRIFRYLPQMSAEGGGNFFHAQKLSRRQESQDLNLKIKTGSEIFLGAQKLH